MTARRRTADSSATTRPARTAPIHIATAAKLYLNWQLSTERQTPNAWSVRTDIAPPPGLKPIWEYPNAHVDGFPKFMEDRARVEQLKQTFALYFGEVKGEPTPGWLGLHPVR